MGERGAVHETASAYREHVNRLLFGVSDDRYEAIVRLLLSLRKPQLSKMLDPEELSQRLTEALPEIDRDAVLRVSARLGRARPAAGRGRRARRGPRACERFAGTYRDYARAALRERGGELVRAAGARDERARELASTERAEREAGERRIALTRRGEELDDALAGARGAARALQASDGWREAERLDELRREAAEAAAEAARASATAAQRGGGGRGGGVRGVRFGRPRERG